MKYQLQKNPFTVPTMDNKVINEHWGRATDGNKEISIAHMIAPPHWSEAPQTPQFDEYTIVLRGKKQVLIDQETIILEAGESIKVFKNTEVQYSNPFDEPCEYVAICRPAFSVETAGR